MNLAIPYNDVQQRGLIPESKLGFKDDSKTKRPKKAVTKVKKPKSKIIRYPTQCMEIGAIKCLFLSCYDRGQSPFLSLGPSWPFTCFLLGFALMILVYFVVMIKMASNPNTVHLYACYLGLATNLFVLFAGILKNPGIPSAVVKRLLKERLGKSQSGEGELSDEDSVDLEAAMPANPLERRKGKLFCNDCKIEMTPDMYHCEDCLVCI